MATTTVDRFDKSRDQYTSYNLYLERRQGNGYYNLGYKIFEPMWADPLSALAVNIVKIQEALKNFYIALQFNPNDVDSRKRINQICDKWGPGGDGISLPPFSTTGTQEIVDGQKLAARKVYTECKC